jgi:hypothetical protein
MTQEEIQKLKDLGFTVKDKSLKKDIEKKLNIINNDKSVLK